MSFEGNKRANMSRAQFRSQQIVEPMVNSISQIQRQSFHGRFYFHTNNRSVGLSTNYGVATENHNQNHGTADSPSVLWNSLGLGFFPEGTILHKLEFIGRCNTTLVTGIKVQLSKQGDRFNGLGYDSVAESKNEVILPPTELIRTAPNWADLQRHSVPLNDHVLQEDKIIDFTCIPEGEFDKTYYWIANRYLYYTLPDNLE